VFPASTLGRSGGYELRDVVRETGLRLVLTGPDLEGYRFWDGVRVERLPFERAVLEAAAVVLPAFIENQPRRLLLAKAFGVPVVASDACGIEAAPGITVVPAGDVRALRAGLDAALGATALS
jgi:glycosyltransferase involved in cell wall biosynthesis